MTPDVITPDLKAVLWRLKLGRLLDTLPERLALASAAAAPPGLPPPRAQRRGRPPQQRSDHDARAVGPERQGHLRPRPVERAREPALQRRARSCRPCRPGRGRQDLPRPPARLARLSPRPHRPRHHRRQDAQEPQAPRLDHTYEPAPRKLLAVDALLIDHFGLDALDPIKSRDTYEILIERHRAGSIVVTSNRGPDEWLATFADPCTRSRRSIASSTTRTTWRSKASPTASARSRRWTRRPHVRHRKDPGGTEPGRVNPSRRRAPPGGMLVRSPGGNLVRTHNENRPPACSCGLDEAVGGS